MLLAVLAVGVAGLAQQSTTEAPTGFETPTLAQDPGSQSTSNGIAQPPGECNTVWKDALNPARIIPGTRISLKGKEQWNESSGKREGEVRS
jgi:hypothetical protein